MRTFIVSFTFYLIVVLLISAKKKLNVILLNKTKQEMK